MSKPLRFIPLLVLFLFYSLIAPLYIQGGDTAELVAASFHRLVPHPPGYPLYLWLQHFWTNVFTVSTVFWRASFLSVILATLSLYLISKPLFSTKYLSLIPLIFLGMSSEFTEAGVLPDVFSLHALFIAIVGYFFLFTESYLLMTFFIILSLANHHTSIFLFPCFGYAVYRLRKDRRIIWTILGGSIVTIALYATLLLCQSEHPLSWGNVTDFPSLVGHFLRTDYGTFQLSAGEKPFTFGPFLFLLKSIWPQLLFALGLLALALKQKTISRKDPKLLIWSFSLLLSFLFPLAMNVRPENMGAEVLRRFHVMPLTLLTIWVVYILARVDLKKPIAWVLFAATLVTAIISLPNLMSFTKLRNDSVIEDYARNLLDSVKDFAPVVVVLNNDSAYFGARYVQALSPSADKKIAFVSLPLFFHDWYLPKVQRQVPEFQIPSILNLIETKRLNTFRDVISPNLKSMRLVVTHGFKDSEALKITFLPLGRILEEGRGFHFQEKPIQINFTPQIDNEGPQYFTKGYLFYQYSHFYQASAAKFIEEEDVTEARKSWERGLKLVPFATPIMVNLCTNFPGTYDFCDEIKALEEKTQSFY